MIRQTFRNTIARYGLIRPGDKVLVAFSGGQDSSALLELLLDLRKEMRMEIILAHFNHKLRPGAGDDEAFVRSVAKARGIPLVVGSRNVRLYARRRKMNIEEAARELRYAFLRRAARAAGAAKIATAHTRTDQAETVLMRLLRGAGGRGLAGIPPQPDDVLIRPLIDVERAAITAFLRERGLPFRTDETNLDRRFFRNRIRLDVLPMLETIEPAAVRHLALTARILGDEETVLEHMTATARRELDRCAGGRPALDAESLALLPRGLSRRVVRMFLSELRGNLRAVTFEDVESVLGLREGKETPIRKDFVLRREGGLIRVKSGRGRAAHKAFALRWDGKDELVLPGRNGRFKATKRPRPLSGAFDYDDGKRAFCDAAAVVFPLTVRNRRPGDRYRPCGAPGSKKLKEILRAKKIPLAGRDALPVFLSGDEILWVPGLPVSDARKVTSRTKSILVIEKI